MRLASSLRYTQQQMVLTFACTWHHKRQSTWEWKSILVHRLFRIMGQVGWLIPWLVLVTDCSSLAGMSNDVENADCSQSIYVPNGLKWLLSSASPHKIISFEREISWCRNATDAMKCTVSSKSIVGLILQVRYICPMKFHGLLYEQFTVALTIKRPP